MGCGENRVSFAVPEGIVYASMQESLPITDLKIDGFQYSKGTIKLVPGFHEITFSIGGAHYSLNEVMDIRKKYSLHVDQVGGVGKTARVICSIVSN